MEADEGAYGAQGGAGSGRKHRRDDEQPLDGIRRRAGRGTRRHAYYRCDRVTPDSHRRQMVQAAYYMSTERKPRKIHTQQQQQLDATHIAPLVTGHPSKPADTETPRI